MENGFIFYKCYFEAIEKYKDNKAKLRLFDAFCNYGLNGIIPENLKPEEQALFTLFQFINDKYSVLSNKEIRYSPAYKLWRHEVFKRDNFTCQFCGENNPKKTYHAHHIKRFALHEDERFNIDNGITLCEQCHKNIHRRKTECLN